MFLAVSIREDIRAAVDAVVAPLRVRFPSVRWVSPELWHLTLIFLGERLPAEVGIVKGLATAVCRDVNRFSLTIEGAGCFPAPARPRVLWVGAGSGVEALAGLRGHLHAALNRGGISMPSESFSAHLTIGRVRDGTSPDARAEIGRLWTATTVPRLAPVEVCAVQLLQSDLGPGGPRYTTLAACSLAAARAD